jgi:hypothetical protein
MGKAAVKKSENPYLQRENVQILRVRGKMKSKENQDKEFYCRVTHPDVESSGMTVFVDCGKYDYSPGDWVEFSFKVPNPFSISGRVIWIQPVARNNRIIREQSVYSTRVGIEFDTSNTEDQALIVNFLAYLENPFFIVNGSESEGQEPQETQEPSEGEAVDEAQTEDLGTDEGEGAEAVDEGAVDEVAEGSADEESATEDAA